MSVGHREGDVVISADEACFTYRELRGDVCGFRRQVAAGGVGYLSTSNAAHVAAALVALEGWASEVRLVPPGVSVGFDAEAVELRTGDGGAVERESDGAATDECVTRWVVYTSGTTGEPKPIVHTAKSLSRTVSSASRKLTWGLLYDPNRMAGLQVLLQALHNEHAVIAATPDRSLADRVVHLIEHQVDALSATPTLWRQVLQVPGVREWNLTQITLGGEIADQRVLDALAETFPSARVVHVFASSETGAAFSVSDGREGFPSSYLAEPPRGISLEVRDDILFVHSPGVSTAGADGYASTGDVVEVMGDRVFFRGRASGVVNVGGVSVWPEVVERILRTHPDVAEAVVSSKPNALTGNLLTAAVQLEPNVANDSHSKVLRAWVREHADGTHVPASVRIVDDLSVAATGKIVR